MANRRPTSFAPSQGYIVLWLFCFTCTLHCAALAAGHEGASGDAQTALKSLSLEQLANTPVMTATKEPEAVWHTAAAIYVLTNDDIRRSGVTNIPDALRLVPGVEVARVSGDRNWAVGIRGFGDQFSKSVLVLIDGRNVYTPLFSGVLWTVQNVMLEDVDRIEVIRGPGGTIWGANAENGIINIITKSAKETQGALLSAGGGNVDHGMAGVRYGGGSGDFNYRIYGMGFDRGPEDHRDHQNYDSWRLGQLGFRTDWKRNARDTFTVQDDTYKGDFGDAQRLSTLAPPAAFISYARMSVSGGNLLGRWRRDLGDRSDIYLQAYYDRTFRIGSNFGETRNTFDIDFLHRLPLGERNEFTYGLGARLSPSTYKQTLPALNFLPHDKTDSIYSAFLQDEVTLKPKKLSLSVGAKLEHNNYSGFEFQPSARLLYTPTEHRSLWTAVTRAVRVPERLDEDVDDLVLAVANPLIFARVLGNRDLSVERLISYEAGYRTLVAPTLYVDVAGFYNVYNDIVGLGAPSISTGSYPVAASTLFTFQYQNEIRGNTHGFEIAPDWKPSSWWRLKGSYSYVHIFVGNRAGFTSSTTAKTYNGSSPTHEAVVESEFDLPKRFEFDQIYRYVSALPAQQVRAYHTADARLGWHMRPNLELSVTGQNLLQPHHVEFGIDPPPNVFIRRSVFAKLVWTSR